MIRNAASLNGMTSLLLPLLLRACILVARVGKILHKLARHLERVRLLESVINVTKLDIGQAVSDWVDRGLNN
jgi:hypothetical protein